MRIEEIDYELPPSAIAQVPQDDRTASKLFVADAGGSQHRRMRDFAELLGPGDVLVINDTRVRPARLRLKKSTGGAVEVFLLHPGPADVWEALVRPSRRVAPGTTLVDEHGAAALVVEDDLGEGRRSVRSASDLAMSDLADQLGEMPLPPYITAPLTDPERYQTVYAANIGSAAAPTAGLHFTPELLAACEQTGASVHRVELQIGLGTFRPITAEAVEEHCMHEERYNVPPETWSACQEATRVVAVGTTVTRALESAATFGLQGGTDLFIRPGYDWKVVDALLTNFHLPQSSLLCMLAAFCGDRWRSIYEEALAQNYRFLSLGDAMFVERSQ